MKVDDVKIGLRKKQKKESISDSNLLSTGSTLLNLACSGRVNGGFLKGFYYFIVGDSKSGKTFLSLTCLAEASINKDFDDYRFIYDNAENGALMNVERFFGRKVLERMEPPAIGDELPLFSQTVEEFYYHVDDAIQNGKPFIYILDSMDSLSSDAEADKFETSKTAHRAGKDASGSYGDNKAKINSSTLRKLLGPLRNSKSILIIINQTRDSLTGFGGKTRSGGRALRFYATVEMWSRVKRKIKRTVKGKERQLGIDCEVKVEKNRIIGRERMVIIPIYYSVGFDDVGSCVHYLVDEGRWKKVGKTIEATGLGPSFKGLPESIIRQIEERELEDDLKELVGQTWAEIELACEVKRKRKYE